MPDLSPDGEGREMAEDIGGSEIIFFYIYKEEIPGGERLAFYP